jgi:hypothetical protein
LPVPDARVRTPLEAIAGFEKVVQLEVEHGPEVKWYVTGRGMRGCVVCLCLCVVGVTAVWVGRGATLCRRFKALRALVILHVERGNSEQMLGRYREMLGYISHVTSNETIEAINRCEEW